MTTAAQQADGADQVKPSGRQDGRENCLQHKE